MIHSNKVEAEELVACPFNASHYVQQSRLQNHLIKCSLSHKNIAGKQTCKFNATHIINEHEMANHLEECPDRHILLAHKFQVGGSEKPLEVLPVKDVVIGEDDHSWDDVNVPTYDPSIKIQSDPNLLLGIRCVPPLERKLFREERRTFGNSSQRDDKKLVPGHWNGNTPSNNGSKTKSCKRNGSGSSASMSGYVRSPVKYEEPSTSRACGVMNGDFHRPARDVPDKKQTAFFKSTEECGVEPFIAIKKEKSEDFGLSGLGRGSQFNRPRPSQF